MELLPSIHAENLFTDQELDHLVQLIVQKSNQEDVIVSSDERYSGAVMEKHHDIDYYSPDSAEIRSIIESKISKLLPLDSKVIIGFILHSIKPILVHTDYIQISGGEPTPTYTAIIPLDNYNSHTVIFNEAQEHSNELEDYKKLHPKNELRADDIAFFRKHLTHLHPSDLRYLSLKESFQWKKGSMFAFDRRHFHCSDNYIKNGEESKKSIILFLGKKD